MSEHTLAVTGMACGGCEETVESALESVDGVSSVSADNETDSVTVETTSDVSMTTLSEAVRDAGYEVAH